MPIFYTNNTFIIDVRWRDDEQALTFLKFSEQMQHVQHFDIQYPYVDSRQKYDRDKSVIIDTLINIQQHLRTLELRLTARDLEMLARPKNLKKFCAIPVTHYIRIRTVERDWSHGRGRGLLRKLLDLVTEMTSWTAEHTTVIRYPTWNESLSSGEVWTLWPPTK